MNIVMKVYGVFFNLGGKEPESVSLYLWGGAVLI